MHKLLFSNELLYRIIRHLLLFVSMVLLFSWVTFSRFGGDIGFLPNLLMVFRNALFFFGYAYLTAYLLIPVFLKRRKIFLFTVVFVALGCGLSVLKFVVSDFLFYGSIAPENQGTLTGLTMARIFMNTKDMTFIVAVFAIAKYAKDNYILESNIQELEEKRLWAEIKLLDHQLNPHIIFNNFNSLYSISIYKSEHLRSTLVKMKAIFHYLFCESKLEKVPLAREIDMIENYIGLEKLRFGERLRITFTSEGNFQNLRIAPLILYSFVENCFVHGAGNEPGEAWISIGLSVKDSHLVFRAANSYASCSRKPAGPVNKVPNDFNIRRLELQYPLKHMLKIQEKPREYRVELHLNL
ncbi:MAG TPA: hypothetical protein ENO20_06325 [Bacteroides sp.]|nr:hypothetical protein [Bacteroides sp.]